MMTYSPPSLPCLSEDVKVGFIGCGNMGRAIAEAWLTREVIQPSQLLISARTSAQRTAEALGGRAVTTSALLNEADIVVLGFKPQQLTSVDVMASPTQSPRPTLVLSLLAGTPLATLQAHLDPTAQRAFVRLMPNLPARLSLGATLAYTDTTLNEALSAQLSPLLDAIGQTEWLSSEGQFDAGTAISGCGPAYLFMVIEALADAGVSLGLPRATAQRLAAQTMLGSGAMALTEHPGVLKDLVTSPGGVTIQGVRALERAGLRAAMIEAVICASERSKALSGSSFFSGTTLV